MISMKVSQAYAMYETTQLKKTSSLDRVSRAEEKRDMVALSTKAKDFKEIKQALANVSDVREDRVSAVRTKLNSPSYHISAHDIAEKIINNL